MADGGASTGGIHKVQVEPSGMVVEAADGELLMSAANRQGIFWPTSCGGDAVCVRCYFVVADGQEESFSPMEMVEREGLRKIRWASGDRPGERLACQARVVGDAQVSRKFVREAREGDLMPFANEHESPSQ